MSRFLQGIFQSSTGATTGCSHASCALCSVYWNLFPRWTLFSRSIVRGMLLPLFSRGSTTTATNPENYDFPKRQQTLVKQGRSDSSPGSLSCVSGLVYLKRDGNLDNAPPSILSNKLSKLLMTWRLYCNYGQVRVCDSLLCVCGGRGSYHVYCRVFSSISFWLFWDTSYCTPSTADTTVNVPRLQ